MRNARRISVAEAAACSQTGAYRQTVPGFQLVRACENAEDDAANMNGSLLTSLYAFAVVFLSLGGLSVVLKWLFGRRREDTRCEAPEHDPRLVADWFEEPARRQAGPVPPMFPQSDAEHFRAAHEAIEQNLPVPLPPSRGNERETW